MFAISYCDLSHDSGSESRILFILLLCRFTTLSSWPTSLWIFLKGYKAWVMTGTEMYGYVKLTIFLLKQLRTPMNILNDIGQNIHSIIQFLGSAPRVSIRETLTLSKNNVRFDCSTWVHLSEETLIFCDVMFPYAHGRHFWVRCILESEFREHALRRSVIFLLWIHEMH